jgi:hypothetical protein
MGLVLRGKGGGEVGSCYLEEDCCYEPAMRYWSNTLVYSQQTLRTSWKSNNLGKRDFDKPGVQERAQNGKTLLNVQERQEIEKIVMPMTQTFGTLWTWV